MFYLILFSAVLIWLVLMPLHFRTKVWTNRMPTLLAKVLPTLIATAFAAYGYFFAHNTSTYALLVFIGLCICTMGDLMIEIRFEVGGTLFFFGHMFYLVAMLMYRALSWWCLITFVIALIGLWLFVLHYKKELPKKILFVGLMIYSIALAGLLGLSLPLPFLAYSHSALLAAVGAALFVTSDLTLCHNNLRKKPVKWHYISLGIYYMGQLLLALSALSNP